MSKLFAFFAFKAGSPSWKVQKGNKVFGEKVRG